MQFIQRLGAAPALLILLISAGCASSRWQYLRTRPDDTTTTKVIVNTEPTGAEVSLNGTYLGEAPVSVPIRYTAEVRVYERRETLPYPHVEKREVKTYVGNQFQFTAIKTGYNPGGAEVTLRGAEEREITIKLTPKPR